MLLKICMNSFGEKNSMRSSTFHIDIQLSPKYMLFFLEAFWYGKK